MKTSSSAQLLLGNKQVVLLVALIAITTRIAAAIALPNAEQDGYSYAEIINRLTNRIDAGQLRVADLYGFWLPLFQLAATALNLVLHNGVVAGKVVNAICGAATIVVVFLITVELTGTIRFALLTAGLMLLNPLHLLYSAACMTDVPHACLVMISLWCAMRRKWLVSAVFGALAGLVRIESWTLLLALPVLQWACERRISSAAVIMLFLPPLIWLVISTVASGDPLHYFHDRARYHAEYIRFHPGRDGFSRAIVWGDISFFLLGAGEAVVAGGSLAAVIVAVQFFRANQPVNLDLLKPLGFAAAMLSLIVLGYVTKAQPVLLPRYGLTFFALGLPVYGWTLQWLLLRSARRWVLHMGLWAAVVLAWLVQIHDQIPTIWKVRQDDRAQRRIAAAVAANVGQGAADHPCFSDDVAVRVLAGLPAKCFLQTSQVPPLAATGRSEFLTYLQKNNVTYLVFFPTEDSLPAKFLPELEKPDQAVDSPFEIIEFAPSDFGPDISLYRIRR
jgi:hypothetical protein